MGGVGNFNHAVSIVGYWIFDFNYKKELPLKQDSLNLICSPWEGEVTFAVFKTVFPSVREINNTGKLNIADYFIN